MNTLQQWLLLPTVAALIGWFTNFLAVRMIFRPYREIRVLGIPFQGLLPKRKKEFAKNIGETVEAHLVSVEDIKKIVDDPKVAARIKKEVEERLDDFIANRLVASNPMLGMFLKGPLVEKIKSGLTEELGGALGGLLGTMGSHIEEHLDLKAIVTEKVESFDMKKLEDICLAVAKRELFAIEILGGVLGFMVGMIQLLALHLLD